MRKNNRTPFCSNIKLLIISHTQLTDVSSRKSIYPTPPQPINDCNVNAFIRINLNGQLEVICRFFAVQSGSL